MKLFSREPNAGIKPRINPLLLALLAAAAVVAIIISVPAAASASPGPWVSHGPSSALIEKNIVFSPIFATDHTVYVPTFGGGMFKSTDSGATWNPVSGGLSTFYIYSAAISPNYASDHIVFAGTWDGGVFKSSNGGGSWTSSNSGIPAGAGMSAIAVSPAFASDNTVFATVNNSGVYKSTDGGNTWNPASNGITEQYVNDIAISANFASDHTLAVAAENNGVFISTDGGANWSPMSNGITDIRMYSVAISPNFASDHKLLAGSVSGMSISTDGGSNWSPCSGYQGEATSIVFSPNYSSDNTVFAGGTLHIQESVTGGTSWTNASSGIDMVRDGAVGISPAFASDQTVIAGTNGNGVYKSTDSGASWNVANSGLISSLVQAIATSPAFATDNTMYASVNGGGVYKSLDRGQSWQAAYAGLPLGTSFVSLQTSPNYPVDHTLFVSTQGAGVYKSVNGGSSWSGPLPGLSGKIIYSIGVSPSFASDSTVFASGTSGQLFKSTDKGDHWLPADSGLPAKEIYAVAVSPNFAADQTLFAGTWGSGVYKSTDGGATWNPVGGYSAPTSIALSPNFAADQTVFTNNGDGIQKSTDGGSTWNPIQVDPAQGTESVVLSPGFASDHTIYVLESRSLVKESVDGGTTWQQVGINLAICNPQSLAIAPQFGSNYSLFAAGNGTGVLTYALTDNSYWTWYDNKGGDDWLLFGQPVAAASADFFSVSIGGQVMSLAGFNNGLVNPGQTIYPIYGGVMGGPVKVSSMNGSKGILSQRILWPKGGGSLEEVPATEESKLSDHFWWTWYDEKSDGYTDWVLVANNNTTPVYYEIKIGGQDPGPGSSGTIDPGQNVTPHFPGVMGGPVEVQAWTDSGKSMPAPVMASQRVLSNYGAAFNEVPGIADTTGAKSDLAGDYYWTWYDNKTPESTDWVLIANKDASANMYYEIDIAGLTVATDSSPGNSPIGPGQHITPTFPGQQGGPVHVRTFTEAIHSTPMPSIASQRTVWGPSFEEVPAYPEYNLTTDYLWTWYDQASGPGVQNWVLVANTNAVPIYYEITIGGNDPGPGSKGTLQPGKNVTPNFPGKIGGPVEVKAWLDSSKAKTAPVLASQRVLWNGHFNEVLGMTGL